MSRTIESRVVQVICEQLGLPSSEVALSSDFVANLGADSLDQIELVMTLEDEFNLEIPDEEAEALHNVQDVMEYVHLRLNTPWSAEASQVPKTRSSSGVRLGTCFEATSRSDEQMCKEAGFDSVSDLLSAYRALQEKHQAALRQLEQAKPS